MNFQITCWLLANLGFGARFLLPIFQKPKSWRILEFVIGCIMWWIAFGMFGFTYQIFVK